MCRMCWPQLVAIPKGEERGQRSQTPLTRPLLIRHIALDSAYGEQSATPHDPSNLWAAHPRTDTRPAEHNVFFDAAATNDLQAWDERKNAQRNTEGLQPSPHNKETSSRWLEPVCTAPGFPGSNSLPLPGSCCYIICCLLVSCQDQWSAGGHHHS